MLPSHLQLFTCHFPYHPFLFQSLVYESNENTVKSDIVGCWCHLVVATGSAASCFGLVQWRFALGSCKAMSSPPCGDQDIPGGQFSFSRLFILFHVYECFVCLHVCELCKKSEGIMRSPCHRIEPGSSARAASAFNYGALSPAFRGRWFSSETSF